MNGSVAQLAGALENFAAAGVDPDIFGFCIVGVHTTQGGHLQAAVAFNGGHHSTQGVGMGFQQQTVVLIFAAQVDDHTALGGDESFKTQCLKGFLYPGSSLSGVAGRGIDGKQLFGHFPCIVCVFHLDHVFILR